jgi:hypothetical protein
MFASIFTVQYVHNVEFPNLWERGYLQETRDVLNVDREVIGRHGKPPFC